MDYVIWIGLYLVAVFLILMFNHGAHVNDQDDYEVYESGSSPTTNDAPEAIVTLVADDDFIEHLHEMGFDDTIEVEEAIIEWDDWAAENLE